MWYFTGAVILATRKFEAFVASGVAAALGILLFYFLKRKVKRVRPTCSPWWCGAVPDEYSFPSGHSLTAFAVVFPLAFLFPSLAPVLLFSAVSVAASRVVLGVHYLSDVVVGAIMGSAIGFLVYFVVSRGGHG